MTAAKATKTVKNAKAPQATQPPPDWWREYFTPLAREVYAGPLKDPIATGHEVDFLASVFEGVEGPLLDIGAGFGRHVREMKKRKFRVVALDALRHMVASHAVRGRRAVVADMRRPPFRDGAFAGAWCLFNSFGYFPFDENPGMVAEWARVLAPGARLVLQAPNRPVMAQIARDFPPSHMLQSDFMLTETYEYDAATRTLHGVGAWMYKDQQQSWEMFVRMYTLGELSRELKRAGLEVERACDDYSGAPFDAKESPQMVIVARKPPVPARKPKRKASP